MRLPGPAPGQEPPLLRPTLLVIALVVATAGISPTLGRHSGAGRGG